MIQKNKGVYEPEFRIVLVVAQMVFGSAGLYGFGITASNVTKVCISLPSVPLFRPCGSPEILSRDSCATPKGTVLTWRNTTVWLVLARFLLCA